MTPPSVVCCSNNRSYISTQMPQDNEYAHIGLYSSSSSPEFAHRKTGNRTLAFQDKLPKLPIPSLEDTCHRYLRALEALQDENEHANTKAAVKQFLETDGPVLHGILEEYAKDKARFVILSHISSLFTDCGSSYIEEFWCDTFTSIVSSEYWFHIGTNPIYRIVIQSYSRWILISSSSNVYSSCYIRSRSLSFHL